MRLVLLALFLFPAHAYTCQTALYRNLVPRMLTHGKPFRALKPATELPLSEKTKAEIDRHKVAQLRERFGDGEELYFVFWHGNGSMFKSSNQALGEHIQTLYLQKMVRHLFPKANFVQRDKIDIVAQIIRKEKTIDLFVSDSHEFSLPGGKKSKAGLEMIDFKAANDTLAGIDREQLRRDFHLPLETRVHSYYLHDIEINSNKRKSEESANLAPSLNAMVESLKSPPQIIFFSKAGKKLPHSKTLLREAEAMGYQGLWLSETTLGKLDLSKKYLIYNDMVARLPYLHALSDVAVVYGPINFLEPLFVRTPTIFFTNESARNDYASEGYLDMYSTAWNTGGAHPVKDLQEFSNTLNGRRLRPPTKLPNAFRMSDNRTPLRRILDQLHEQIESEIN